MKLPRGASLVLLENAAGTVLGAVLGILCARFWGPSLAGSVALSFTLAGVFHFISCLGMDQIVVARFAVRAADRDWFAATLLLRCVAVGLSACALCGMAFGAELLAPEDRKSVV